MIRYRLTVLDNEVLNKYLKPNGGGSEENYIMRMFIICLHMVLLKGLNQRGVK
jgi:hypothetical protein